MSAAISPGIKSLNRATPRDWLLPRQLQGAVFEFSTVTDLELVVLVSKQWRQAANLRPVVMQLHHYLMRMSGARPTDEWVPSPPSTLRDAVQTWGSILRELELRSRREAPRSLLAPVPEVWDRIMQFDDIGLLNGFRRHVGAGYAVAMPCSIFTLWRDQAWECAMERSADQCIMTFGCELFEEHLIYAAETSDGNGALDLSDGDLRHYCQLALDHGKIPLLAQALEASDQLAPYAQSDLVLNGRVADDVKKDS